MTMKIRYTVIDGEVIAEKRNGVRRQYVPDSVGSTVALLDNTQAQTDTFVYWPYGDIQSRTGTTPTPFKYIGTAGYYATLAKQIYVRFRFYNATTIRWDTKETDLDSSEWYTYSYNNPVSFIDPDGQRPAPPKGGANPPKNLPAPGILQPGQCPGSDAYQMVNSALKNKACSDALKKACGVSTIVEVVRMFRPQFKETGHHTIYVSDVCQDPINYSSCENWMNLQIPKSPCQKGCQPVGICFTSRSCNDSTKKKASALLWELVNGCTCCTTGQGNEKPSSEVTKACGFGGLKPGRTTKQQLF